MACKNVHVIHFKKKKYSIISKKKKSTQPPTEKKKITLGSKPGPPHGIKWDAPWLYRMKYIYMYI